MKTGYSMIELLVVVILLAVLATQAMPAYHQHVVRTRRNEAQSALLKLMLQQERYYSQHNTYVAFSSASAESEARQFQWWSGSSPARSAYELEGRACDGEPIAQCVQLVATPGTAQVDRRFRDDDCGVLMLSSTGQRLASGAASGCWP
jgi:type IV pilus assembly protein PilE